MEFRKMVTITLYARQQKRHRCIERTFGLWGRGRGWDDLGKWHWNMYIIICETNHQSRFDAFGLWCWRRLFFFYSFIYFLPKNFFWRLILHNIVLVLSYTDMNPPWVYMCSTSWTPLPPVSSSHPSGLSQCISPKHPVSCIDPELVIPFTYDNIHVSMPFSQIIPPSPSPTESKRCLIHLCLFCYLTYRVVVTIFLNSIYMR